MTYSTRRRPMVIAAISIGIASGALWIALSHNPQGEFYGSELGLNWTGILTLWGVTFIATFALLSILTWMAIKTWHAITPSKGP